MKAQPFDAETARRRDRINLGVWEARKSQYPHRVQLPTQADPGVRAVGSRFDPYLRVPLPGLGTVLWGFTTEAHLRAFLATFDPRNLATPADPMESKTNG